MKIPGSIKKTVMVIAATAIAAGCLMPAQGAAPMPKTQPGFYRMMLGDFEVTALNDGVVSYPVSRLLPTATLEQIKSGLSESGLTDPVGLSYNASSSTRVKNWSLLTRALEESSTTSLNFMAQAV